MWYHVAMKKICAFLTVLAVLPSVLLASPLSLPAFLLPAVLSGGESYCMESLDGDELALFSVPVLLEESGADIRKMVTGTPGEMASGLMDLAFAVMPAEDMEGISGHGAVTVTPYISGEGSEAGVTVSYDDAEADLSGYGRAVIGGSITGSLLIGGDDLLTLSFRPGSLTLNGKAVSGSLELHIGLDGIRLDHLMRKSGIDGGSGRYLMASIAAEALKESFPDEEIRELGITDPSPEALTAFMDGLGLLPFLDLGAFVLLTGGSLPEETYLSVFLPYLIIDGTERIDIDPVAFIRALELLGA